MNEQFGHRDSERFRDVIRWKNVSGETVPAFGVVQIGQWDDAAGAYDGEKPSASGTIWVPNGPAPVPDESYGSSLPWVRKQLVMTDGVTTDPVGKVVGPVAGEWHMAEGSDNPHFVVMGKRADEDVCSVILKGGGGGGGGSIMHFTIDDVDCDTGEWVVTPTHYTGGCEDPPGADPYTGEYCVTPFCGSPFTDEELVASGKGVAAYTYNLETCRLYWLEISHCAEQGC